MPGGVRVHPHPSEYSWGILALPGLDPALGRPERGSMAPEQAPQERPASCSLRVVAAGGRAVELGRAGGDAALAWRGSGVALATKNRAKAADLLATMA